MKLRLFVLLFILCLSIGIVNAETLTGELSYSGVVSQNYRSGGTGSTTGDTMSLRVVSMENTAGLKTFIHFDESNTRKCTFDAGTPVSNSTTFVAKIGSTVISTGTVGYQRLYDGAFPTPSEIAGYQYWIFDNWTIGSYTGAQTLTLTYNATHLGNMRYLFAASNNTIYGVGGESAPTSYMYLYLTGGGYAVGNTDGKFLQNRDISFANSYTATKPAGIGISGTVFKTALGGGTAYSSRAYIVDNSGGSGSTSESVTSTTAYNFTTSASSIIVAVKSSTGSWFNSSPLFAAAIPTVTPTATPTAVGTYTEADFSTVTLTVRNNVNSSLISGAQVQLYRHDAGQHIDTAYTNDNGIAVFSNVNIRDYKTQEIKVVKSGYQITNEWITISPFYYSKTVYLSPDIGGNPSVPENINLTLTVRNSNGGALISNAYVTAFDAQAQLSGAAGYTNASGIVVFQHFANTPFIEGKVSKTGFYDKFWYKEPLGEISQTDYAGTIYINSISGGGGATPTPTPTLTPVPYDTISLSANPASIPVGSSSVLTTSCSNATACQKPTLSLALYYENSNSPNGGGNKLVGMYKFNATANNYDFRPNNVASWQFGFSNPLTLTIKPTIASQYTYSVALSNYTGATDVIARSLGTAKTSILVGGGGDFGILTMLLSAQDGATTSRLNNYQLNITDFATGIIRDLGTVSYDYELSLPRGSIHTLQCSKTGYIDGSIQFTVPTDESIIKGDYGAQVSCKLFPLGSTSLGNTSVTVHVNDAETYYPLGNVEIRITGSGFTNPSPRYTGQSGESALFLIPNNMDYIVTATKDGYCSVSDAGNTGTDSYQYVPLFMKYGACSGATPTPTPTPTITPTVTVTPFGGYGNQTGKAVACSENLPSNATIVQVLRNAAACNGITDDIGQGLALAVVIILICAIILGRVAKGIGVLAGAIVGAVVSMAMGFLPFWIIIVLIILSGLVFAGKIFWSGGQ